MLARHVTVASMLKRLAKRAWRTVLPTGAVDKGRMTQKPLLVDDHSIMREGLQSMLKDSEEFEVVGQARDGVEAVSAAAELSPDVIVMDVMMPGKDGVEACREIMESAPDIRVVMLTASAAEDAVIEAVAAGATGYLQKVSGMDRLLSTLKLVAAG